MSKHVVLWECDQDLARMISCRLMRADFEVHTVHDGETAWQLIHRLQPQLLIADLQFPGIELICKVRGDLSTTRLPVIALSAGRELSPVVETMRRELQLDTVLPKPFSLRRLVRLALDATSPALAYA